MQGLAIERRPIDIIAHPLSWCASTVLPFGENQQRMIQNVGFKTDHGHESSLCLYKSEFCYIGSPFGGLSRTISSNTGTFGNAHASFARNEQSDSGKYQEKGKNSEPLSVFGNSFIGGIAAAWRRASPGRLFVAGSLFAIGWFGLLFSIAVFFGDK